MIVKIIHAMYCNSEVRVRFNGVCGNDWPVKNGIRQGGVLSPHLFNYYINSVIESLCETNVGCSLEFEKMHVICYADDMAILAPSQNALKLLSNKACDLLGEIGLNVNFEKTSYMVFGNKNLISQIT